MDWFSLFTFLFLGTVDDLDLDTVLHECTQLLGIASNHIPITMVTLGRHGVMLSYHGESDCKLPLRGDVVQVWFCELSKM